MNDSWQNYNIIANWKWHRQMIALSASVGKEGFCVVIFELKSWFDRDLTDDWIY
jgi:hypothetical protein